MAILFPLSTPGGSREASVTREGNDLPVFGPPEGNLKDLVLFPGEGRGVQVVQVAGNTSLFEFRLVDFKLTRQAILSGISYPSDRERAYDLSSGRVWILGKGGLSCAGGNNLSGLPATRIDEIDLRKLELNQGCLTDPTGNWRGPFGLGLSFKAFDAYVPSAGAVPKFIFQWAKPNVIPSGDDLLPGNLLTVSQVDRASGNVDWSVPVRSCSQTSMTQGLQNGGIIRSRVEEAIYVFCLGGNRVAQVVRLALGKGSDPTKDEGGNLTVPLEAAYPGSTGLEYIVTPDAAGGRMHIGADPDAVWVFDGMASSFVAVLGMRGGVRGAYLEPRSGRLYRFLISSDSSLQGLYLTDGRMSPVDQFERYAVPYTAGSSARILSAYPPDKGRPGRVFIQPDTDARSLWVIQDHRPVSNSKNVIDDSTRTDDIEEKDGLTKADFSGEGKGYGFRSLLISGLEGVLPGTTVGGGLNIAAFRGASRLVGSPCTRNDREIVFGRIRNAELSKIVVSAEALVADADPTTRSDLATPTQSCWPIPGQLFSGDTFSSAATQYFPPGNCNFDEQKMPPLVSETTRGQIKDQLKRLEDCQQPLDREIRETIGTWEGRFPPVSCGSGRDEWRDAASNSMAQTGCDLEQSRVSARVRHKLAPASDESSTLSSIALSVSDAGASTDIFLDPIRGIVTKTRAWSRGIVIPGIGKIAEVWAEAESWAKGRPGTAGSKYEARVCGFRQFDSQEEMAPSCRSPQEVASVIARVLGSRGTASATQLDRELQSGSPRGYQASVQKDRRAQLSSRALNNDQSTEAPALEIILWDDSIATGRARQVYQLAGLQASSQYGISRMPALLEDAPELGRTKASDLRFVETGVAVETHLAENPASPLNSSNTLNRKILKGLRLTIRSPLATLGIWFAIVAPLFMLLRRRASLLAD